MVWEESEINNFQKCRQKSRTREPVTYWKKESLRAKDIMAITRISSIYAEPIKIERQTLEELWLHVRMWTVLVT